jgi:hypothetical protein
MNLIEQCQYSSLQLYQPNENQAFSRKYMKKKKIANINYTFRKILAGKTFILNEFSCLWICRLDLNDCVSERVTKED